MNGFFELKKAKNGQFIFNLKAGNGQVIMTSEMYTTKSAAENGMESVRKNCGEEKRFERKVASNGKFYFSLDAANGQSIGKSQMYKSLSGRNNGIKSVMTNGKSKVVKDLTE